MSCLGLYFVSSSLACHVYFMLCIILFFCFSFELHFLIHLAPLIHHTLAHIFFFLSLFSFDSFVYSWQKGGEYTKVYCHFYMTHVHILRGRNSISCTFVGRKSHKGDVYTKREKTSFLRKPCFVLFYFMLIFLLFYDALLCLVSILYCFHRIMLMCWTCILPYVIVLYWLHVRMIICFTIWSL